MAEEVRSFEHGPTGLVLLYLNGEPTDQKPPLYYWAAALFGVPGGRVTETAARLPSALAGIAWGSFSRSAHCSSRAAPPRR